MFEMSSSLEFPLQRHAMATLIYRNRREIVVEVRGQVGYDVITRQCFPGYRIIT